MDLHLVKHIISVDCLGHWHDVVKHEPGETPAVSTHFMMAIFKGIDLLNIFLLLLQESKCFWEDGADWASTHLESHILSNIKSVRECFTKGHFLLTHSHRHHSKGSIN